MNGHLSEDEVERYSLGGIPESEAGPLEEHLLLCRVCQQRVDASDTYLRAMRQAAARIRLEPERPPQRRRLLLAFAGALVILALAVPVSHKATAPVTIGLMASRTEMAATAPADTPLILRPDVTGLPSATFYKVEMVDRTGKPVWSGKFPGARVKAAAPGTYFVRLYAPGGELLREYGLDVQGRQ